MRNTYLHNMLDRFAGLITKAAKQGASAAKVSFSHGESLSCSFEAGRLKYADSAESLGYNIATIRDGRSGVAGGNIPDAMDELLERAISFARIGAVAHFSHYPAPGSYVDINSDSPRVLTLTREKMISDCQDMVAYVKSLDDSLDISASADRSESESAVVNSAGLHETDTQTSWSISLGIQKTSGTDMLFSYAGRGWLDLNELYDLEALKSEIAFDLQHAARSAKISDGTYPIYLPPRMIRSFLAPISMGINGRDVFKGSSPLKDELGKQCFSPALTIIDNPHIDFSPSSAAFDGAGIATRPMTLVDQGVLTTFLYDYDSACLAQATPTGHSGCSPYTMFVQPGQRSADAMLKSIPKGLYIKQLLGFGQSNLANGDFSCNAALAYLIEDGEIVGRVKNAMVAGNILCLLKGDIEFSSDLDPQTRQPYAIIPGVSVVTAKN
ncbi:MAG: TldD/PmbA family protein [Lentisphaerae bacterium]|nr:TldD/PmbA family protein [Lentisphaerota bacterium]